jgi:hypothetical protein
LNGAVAVFFIAHRRYSDGHASGVLRARESRNVPRAGDAVHCKSFLEQAEWLIPTLNQAPTRTARLQHLQHLGFEPERLCGYSRPICWRPCPGRPGRGGGDRGRPLDQADHDARQHRCHAGRVAHRPDLANRSGRRDTTEQHGLAQKSIAIDQITALSQREAAYLRSAGKVLKGIGQAALTILPMLLA